MLESNSKLLAIIHDLSEITSNKPPKTVQDRGKKLTKAKPVRVFQLPLVIKQSQRECQQKSEETGLGTEFSNMVHDYEARRRRQEAKWQMEASRAGI